MTTNKKTHTFSKDDASKSKRPASPDIFRYLKNKAKKDPPQKLHRNRKCQNGKTKTQENITIFNPT